MMTVKALNEGLFIVDNNKEFHRFNSNATNHDDNNANIKGIKVAINPFLIKTRSDLLLIDTGLGHRIKNNEMQIYHNIKKQGFEPSDVTKVLLTHLHLDHVSGAFHECSDTKELIESFPRAKYFFQAKELKNMLGRDLKPAHYQILKALQSSKSAVSLDGNGTIDEYIEYEISGGHTEFHQVFNIKRDNINIFCGGDVLPQPEQLNIKFIAKYDFDGSESAKKRIEYAEKLTKNNFICLFYHGSNISVGSVKKQNNSFLTTNAIF